MTLINSADRTNLLIPALHSELLPQLPLGKVVWVHGLLRGVPMVQHPLRDLRQQGKEHTFYRTLRKYLFPKLFKAKICTNAKENIC